MPDGGKRHLASWVYKGLMLVRFMPRKLCDAPKRDSPLQEHDGRKTFRN